MKKIFIFVVITALIGGAGYFFIHNQNRQKASSVSPTPKDSIVKIEQMQTAEIFFKTFTGCVSRPPKEAGGDIEAYCLSTNKYVSKDLAVNLEKQSASGICGQNPPKSAYAKRAMVINDNQALVVLTEDFGSKKIDVRYQLQRVNGEWKVENIICPE